jgi:hypothetical protein
MPVPQALVTQYFQLIVSRQFTEAERQLERLKQKMQKTEWNRGYFRALYGMYLAKKNNEDSYSFFVKLDLTDKATLHGYRKEFLDHTRNGLHGDFDRGYFSAWADCMRVLARMDVADVKAVPAEVPVVEGEAEEASVEPHAEPHLETLRTDKSQATIANFLKGDAGEDVEEAEE